MTRPLLAKVATTTPLTAFLRLQILDDVIDDEVVDAADVVAVLRGKGRALVKAGLGT